MSNNISFLNRCISIKEYTSNVLYHHHESYVVKMLEFDSVNELKEYIKRCKKGGDGGGGNPSPYNDKMNFKMDAYIDNELHLHHHKHGSSKSNYYIFKRFKNNTTFMPISQQMAIIDDVVGKNSRKYSKDVNTRRKKEFHACVEGETNTYYNLDLPEIAIKHGNSMGINISDTWDATSTPEEVCHAVRAQLRILLRVSHIIPPPSNASIIKRRSKRKQNVTPTTSSKKPRQEEPQSEEDALAIEDGVMASAQSATSNASSTTSQRFRGSSAQKSALEETGESPVQHQLHGRSRRRQRHRGTTSATIPEDTGAEEREYDSYITSQVLTFANYKGLWRDKKYEEVGTYELLVEFIIENEDKNDLANDICLKIKRIGGIVVSMDLVKSMIRCKGVLFRKRLDFNKLKEWINGVQLFPCRLDEKEEGTTIKGLFLLEYLNDAKQYTNGERFPRDMMIECKDNNQPMLSDEAAACIRQILYAYKVKLCNFPAMLNSFAVLLLGRSLNVHEFCSVSTIRARLVRLSCIDRFNRSEEDKAFFLKRTEYGAWVSFGMTTDDTQHGEKTSGKSHVAIRSRGFYVEAEREEDDNFMVGAGWDLLTTSKAASEDNKGNSELNFKVLLAEVDHDVVAYLNLYCFDNAALGEGYDTHDLLMNWLDEKESPMTHFYGVRRRPVVVGDFFHCCQILSSLASVKFSGETTRDLREFHPRRVLQHLHDICRRERILSDHVAKTILSEAGETDIDRGTARERGERWGSNGEFSLRVVAGTKIDINGQNFWVRWAEEMALHFDKSNFRHDVLREIAKHLMNEGVIVSLIFEAELVSKYFNVTYAYHAFGGENCDRAGFRLLELPYLLIDFIVPTWKKAESNPAAVFPDTVEAINQMKDQDKAEKRMEQLRVAIDAAVDRMGTLHEKWFQAPLVFTFITHPVHGPPLLRVLLNCVKDAINDIPEDDRDFDYDGDNVYDIEDEKGVVCDADNQWAKHNYAGINGMPMNMQPWYTMLHPLKEDILHWWRQLGFGTQMLRDELKDLSREDIDEHPEDSDLPRNTKSSTRLHDFYTHYPKIYDFLRASFSHGPSNSRIGEMAHSFVRQFFDEQIPYQRLDDMLRFIMDKEYGWREERRAHNRKTRKAKLKYGIRNRGTTKDRDTKATCAMAGMQLDASLSQYNPEAIAKLPPEIQEKIKISKIKKEGTKQMEKDRDEKVLEKFEAIKQRKAKKKKKSSQSGLDLDKIQEESDKAQTEHEKNWSSREYLAEMEVVSKFLNKTYYTSITGKTGDGKSKFHRELKLVLPGLFNKKVEKSTKKAISDPAGDEKINLGKYLQSVKDIAFKGETNNKLAKKLTKKKLADMNQLQILQYFVKTEKSPNLKEVRANIKLRRSRVNAVMKSFGTEVFDLKRYQTTGNINNNDDDDVNNDVEMPTLEFSLGEGC